jgi:pimeloyl-ACP methyl ester carboxylesterase
VSDPITAYLRIRSATAPQWVADDQIAFLYDATGVMQLYTMTLTDHWPDQRTFEHERVLAVLGSPDGSLVFTRDVGGNERGRLYSQAPPVTLAAADAIHTLGAFAPHGGELAFAHTERNGTDFDLAIVRLATGERRELATLSGWWVVCDWHERGILAAEVHSNLSHTLWLVSAETGKRTAVAPQTPPARFLPARFQADGRIVCATDHDADFARLARIEIDGSINALTADDADIEDIATHGSVVAYVENRAGTSRLVIDDTLITGLPDGVISGITFSPDATTVACTVSPPDAPTDIHLVSRDGRSWQLTRAPRGGVRRGGLRRPTLASFASFDGLEVAYLLYGAADTPTLCHIHGGPESQARPALNPVIQYLAARGISVAVPNVRGSTGYGARYAALDDRELRADAASDLAMLARRLGAARGVPVGVMGSSYGGYMTLQAITRHPDLWRCAVDVVGIANLETFLEQTGTYRRRLREVEYGSLATDRDLLRSLSPIHQVAAIRCPLMLIHGANDPRVPLNEATQIAEAVSAQGGDVTLLVYDNEGHGLARLENRIDAYPRVVAFLEHHLLTATTPPA